MILVYAKQMKKILSVLSVLVFSGWAGAFDTWWHAESTRVAMTQNGFSADARLATQVSNYFTDFISVKESYSEAYPILRQMPFPSEPSYDFMHFDAVFGVKNIENNWQYLLNNTIRTLQMYNSDKSLPAGYRLVVLFNILGASLHVVQDFYSHSNWLESYTKLGQKPIPIWFAISPSERAKLSLDTGAYPAGSAPGKPDHDDLNKDASHRPLNLQAVEVATRASVDWVSRLIKSTPNLPWAELQKYDVQKNMLLRNFLYQLDASFLTSSSIAFGHFDGIHPAKFVFAADGNLEREENMAKQVLLRIMPQYLSNIKQSGLPSPYWVGFLKYRIVNELAIGLYKNDKIYIRQ